MVLRQQYEIYSKWYYNAIRELVVIFDFRNDYELLGKMLRPAIAARKAREAVKLLERAGRYLVPFPTDLLHSNQMVFVRLKDMSRNLSLSAKVILGGQ